MDQNNLNNSAINLNTKIQEKPTKYKIYEIFSFPKLSMCYYNKTTFWGMGIFLRILNCKRENFDPPS